MDRGLAISLTAFTGGLIALQAPINSELGRVMGTWQAVTLSFLVGTVLLLGIAAVAPGGLGGLGKAGQLPWYYIAGGVLGAAYVTTVLVTIRTLGAGGVTAATIAGQLTTSVVIDQLGLLGVVKQPVTVLRVLGIALLVVGTYLIIRE
jgi:transporter family-2 protein